MKLIRKQSRRISRQQKTTFGGGFEDLEDRRLMAADLAVQAVVAEAEVGSVAIFDSSTIQSAELQRQGSRIVSTSNETEPATSRHIHVERIFGQLDDSRTPVKPTQHVAQEAGDSDSSGDDKGPFDEQSEVCDLDNGTPIIFGEGEGDYMSCVYEDGGDWTCDLSDCYPDPDDKNSHISDIRDDFKAGLLTPAEFAIEKPQLSDYQTDRYDFSDFLTLSANFGSTDANREEGDLDADGLVGFSDFLVLSSNFGDSAPSINAGHLSFVLINHWSALPSTK